MKVIVFIASVFASASAFTRPSVVPRQTTAINIINNNYLNSLDAERVVIEECNQEECTMVEGVHDDEGWHLTGELQGENSSVRVLMMETGDTE